MHNFDLKLWGLRTGCILSTQTKFSDYRLLPSRGGIPIKYTFLAEKSTGKLQITISCAK